MAEQQVLVETGQRCMACGRLDAPELRKIHRLRVCPDCWAEHVAPALETQAQYEAGDHSVKPAVGVFWSWYTEIIKRYPRQVNYKQSPPMHEGLNYNPVCDCGRALEPLKFAPANMPSGLFGGPFEWKCEHCRIADEVRFTATSEVLHKIKPGWDDEDWLEYFWQYNRRAFELEILPDLWFEVRVVVDRTAK